MSLPRRWLGLPKLRALRLPVAEARVNVHEAKTHLSRLLERVLTGEEIVIARAGKPIARLVPFDSILAQDRKLGELGSTLMKRTRDAQAAALDPV